MKSALCSSTLLWAIRAVEKLRKKLYHGVFIAEVISALPLFQPPPPSPAWGPGSGFPTERACYLPGPPGVPTARVSCGSLFWGQSCLGHCSISGAVSQGRHRRGSPLCTTVTPKHFFSKGHWRKLTFGGRIRSPPSKQVPLITKQYSRGDSCSAITPWRGMPQHTAISFPPSSGLRAASQDWVALGDSQLLVTSLRYTLLPPGGTKKSCQRRD